MVLSSEPLARKSLPERTTKDLTLLSCPFNSLINCPLLIFQIIIFLSSSLPPLAKLSSGRITRHNTQSVCPINFLIAFKLLFTIFIGLIASFTFEDCI